MIKKVLIAAIIFFMSMSAAEAGVWQPELRVGILSGVEQVTLKVSAPCVMTNAATGEAVGKIPAGKKFIVKFAKLRFDAIEIRPEKIPIIYESERVEDYKVIRCKIFVPKNGA